MSEKSEEKIVEESSTKDEVSTITNMTSESKSSDTVKFSSNTSDNGSSVFAGACKFCDNRMTNVEVKDGKVKCPECNREF